MIRLLVGLGNTGRLYRRTRHNVGFLVIEEIERRGGRPAGSEVEHCLVSRVVSGEGLVILARPALLMNRSGLAVRALLAREGVAHQEMLVVCDDLHLPLGALRLRRQGSHGGHNGLRSIIDALGTGDFPRLRVGIGPAGESEDQADFVLAGFPPEERARLPEIVGTAADCVEMVVREGLGQAMNRFNRKPDVDPSGADTY